MEHSDCTSIKNYEGKHHFKCLNLTLNYLKLLFYNSRTFILNVGSWVRLSSMRNGTKLNNVCACAETGEVWDQN